MFDKIFNSLAKEKEKNFKKELAEVENLQQFFFICGKYYDLENTKLGTISKTALVSNIDKIILMTNAKLKK